MPFEKFDRSRLEIFPLEQRVHDVDISVVKSLDDPVPPFSHPELPSIARDVVAARREQDATVLMMYGAHVIRTGNGLHMIELMKRGLVTHFATNGAGSIHDYELALIGRTCESVAKYISMGQFGLWTETGRLNDIIKEGVRDGLGWGEAVGRYIWEEKLPNREKSVLGMGYHLGVPCTVHIGVGNDIIHEHPNCDGAAMGEASYNDFLIYAQRRDEAGARGVPQLRLGGRGTGGLPQGARDGPQRRAAGGAADRPFHDRGLRPAGDRKRGLFGRAAQERPALLFPPVEDDPRPHGGGRRREPLHPGRAPEDGSRAGADDPGARQRRESEGAP